MPEPALDVCFEYETPAAEVLFVKLCAHYVAVTPYDNVPLLILWESVVMPEA